MTSTVEGGVLALGVASNLALLGAKGSRKIDFEGEDWWFGFNAADVFESGGCVFGLSCYAGSHKAGKEGESRHGSLSRLGVMDRCKREEPRWRLVSRFAASLQNRYSRDEAVMEKVMRGVVLIWEEQHCQVICPSTSMIVMETPTSQWDVSQTWAGNRCTTLGASLGNVQPEVAREASHTLP